jgi:o-succinylbenzoate synthase
MSLRATLHKKVFQFSFKARTSRGLMRDKTSWFLILTDDEFPGIKGIGECGPLPGLSVDDVPDFEARLVAITEQISKAAAADLESLLAIVPRDLPAVRFGLETAWLDLRNGGKRLIFQNEFTRGKMIPINGLIWMGDLDFMMNQINQKIAQGFNCIKLKVGGLDFDRECDVLQYIRKRYFKQDIEIRLDANGAFKLDDALYKLTELSKFNIQSIEQPIKPNLPEMEELCRKSPIPVAFDEELIGKFTRGEKEGLLRELKPKYIILKPTLLGGFGSCAEWIEIATVQNIGWWVTSALESNIGLNAICQFTAGYPVTIPHGLGTGGIYENNFNSPLAVESGHIRYRPDEMWELTEFMDKEE